MKARQAPRVVALLGLIPLVLLTNGWAESSTFASIDPLDKPALQTPLASKGLINGLTHAEASLVAVGQRGHVLTSDDQGKNWAQASVPVSSDLVAVHFPSAKVGYAVGHDGVVLKSIDGGKKWSLILDGRSSKDVENPYLDVWFDTEDEGYVVGAFGKILYTSDGGQNWANKAEAVDNPNSMHIYSIKRLGGELYLAGEQGLFNRYNPNTQHFDQLSLPYKGSLFGMAGDQHAIWAYGLRGNLFRSADQGQHWQQVPTGVSGAFTASALGHEGNVSIVSLSGQMVIIQGNQSGAGSEPEFKLSVQSLNQPAAAVLAAVDGYVLGGLRGLSAVSVNPTVAQEQSK